MHSLFEDLKFEKHFEKQTFYVCSLAESSLSPKPMMNINYDDDDDDDDDDHNLHNNDCGSCRY